MKVRVPSSAAGARRSGQPLDRIPDATTGLVTIARYLYTWEAEIVRGLLESEGIPATLADENIVRLNWSYALAVGGVRLQVPVQCVEAARSVMLKQQQGEYALALEKEFELPPATCSKCGARDLQPIHSVWWLVLLALSFGLAAIFPPPRNGVRCGKCRYQILDTP